MKAIISDIHGNLEALHAVLLDIKSAGASDIYCLGDLVGYGPNPCECIDLATQWNAVLLGNFDLAILEGHDGFGIFASQSIEWTEKQFEGDSVRRQFLAKRPRTLQEGRYLFVHGSPRNPLNEYIFPEDIYNQPKLQRNYALFDGCCFKSHTHVPGIFVEPATYYSPVDVDGVYQLTKARTMVDVGAVGQPRDRDWRASYVLLDGDTIHFRRVEYDVEATIRKIHGIPEVDPFLGDRLREGK